MPNALVKTITLGSRTIALDSGLVQPGGSYLRPFERRLLEYLAEHIGQTVSHEEILREVWGYAPGVRTQTVYTTLYRLRRSVEEDASHPVHLVSHPGDGISLEGAFVSTPERAPSAGDPFYGRSDELRWLEADAPILVLHGPSGVGKTRLAREHAQRSTIQTLRVPLFVSLLGECTAPALSAAIGRGLGAEIRDIPQLEGLLAGMGPLLIVLDDAESLDASALASLVRVVRASRTVRWVVVSRLPHVISCAQHIPVGPLPADDALELLIARVRAANPGASLDRGALVSMMALLDGFPLAIEIAAAHIARLGSAVTLKLLGQIGDLPNTDASAPERHRSIGALARWSVSALEPGHRSALGSLQIFDESFDLDAAACVMGLDLTLSFGILSDLVSQSLVKTAGETRFALYATVRAVLPPSSDDVVERFIDYFAAAAGRWLDASVGVPLKATPCASFARAARFAIDRGHPKLADLLTAGLHTAPLDAALALAEAASVRGVPAAAAVEVRAWRARRHFIEGETTQWLAAYEGLAEDAAAAGRMALSVRVDLERARHLLNSGQSLAAKRSFERAMQWRQEIVDPPPLLADWFDMYDLLLRAWLGAPDESLALCERALVYAARIGDPSIFIYVRNRIADALRRRGRLQAAERLLRVLLAEVRTQPTAAGQTAEIANRLAQTLLEQGRADEAVDWATEAIQCSQGARWLVPFFLVTRARAYLRQGAIEKAAADTDEAEQAAALINNPFLQVIVASIAARVERRQGWERAEHGIMLRDRALSLGAVHAACTVAACIVNVALERDDLVGAMSAIAPLLKEPTLEHTPRAVEIHAELLLRAGDLAGAIHALQWLERSCDERVSLRARLASSALRGDLPQGVVWNEDPWSLVWLARLQRARGEPFRETILELSATPGDTLLRQALLDLEA